MYYTHLYGEIRKLIILLYMVFDIVLNVMVATCRLPVVRFWPTKRELF